jgi:peroxiredoxin
MVTATTSASLAARFGALECERERTWTPEELARNRAQRQTLRDAFDAARAVKAGDIAPQFALETPAGEVLTSGALLAAGPVVLIFFRYADCPADNIALPIYDRVLTAPLRDAGIRVLAVSPQLPDRLGAIGARWGLGLTLATDRNNVLARAFGLTFTPLSTPDPPPPGWIGETTGTGTWELPQTAIVIIDRDRRIRFAAISPDWLDRTEPGAVLAALGDAGLGIALPAGPPEDATLSSQFQEFLP